MQTSFSKQKALAWTIAGLVLAVAALPAMLIPISQAHTLANADLLARQMSCESALRATATRHEGTFSRLTLTVPRSQDVSYTLSDVQNALMSCSEYRIEHFCAGEGCGSAELTLTLRLHNP